MEQSNNTAQLIGALILGAAVGATLGILFAPAKGSDTRKKIAGKSGELTDAIKDKMNAFMHEIQKELEDLKTDARESVSK